jgi:hypothetical protein
LYFFLAFSSQKYYTYVQYFLTERRREMQMSARIQSKIQRIVEGASALKAVKEFSDPDVEVLYGIRRSVEEVLEALPQCAVCKKPRAGLITFGRGSGLEHLGKLCRPCAAAALSGASHPAPKARKARKPREKKAEGGPAPPDAAARKGMDEFDKGAEEDSRVRQVSEASGLGLEETMRVVAIMEEAAIPMPQDSMLKNVQQELRGEKDAAARFDPGRVGVAVTEYYRLKGAERIGGDPDRPRRKARR